MNITLYTNQSSLQTHQENNTISFSGLMSCIGVILINDKKGLTYFLHLNCGHFYKRDDYQDTIFSSFIEKNCKPSDSLKCIFIFNNSSYERKETYDIVKDFIFEASKILSVESICLCNEFSNILKFNSKGKIKNFMSKRDPVLFQELLLKGLIEEKTQHANIDIKNDFDDKSCFNKCNIF